MIKLKAMKSMRQPRLPIPSLPIVKDGSTKAANEHTKAAGMHRMAAAKAKGKGEYTAAAEHHRMAADSHMRAQAAKQKPYPKSAMNAVAGMI